MNPHVAIVISCTVNLLSCTPYSDRVKSTYCLCHRPAAVNVRESEIMCPRRRRGHNRQGLPGLGATSFDLSPTWTAGTLGPHLGTWHPVDRVNNGWAALPFLAQCDVTVRAAKPRIKKLRVTLSFIDLCDLWIGRETEWKTLYCRPEGNHVIIYFPIMCKSLSVDHLLHS